MAVYGSDTWPLDGAPCVKVAIDLGMAAGELAALLADCEADAAREAHRRGASGVPTFLVGDSLSRGSDRLVLCATT